MGILLLAVALGTACGSSDYDARLAEVHRAIAAGRSDDALRGLLRVRSRYPGRREPYVLLAGICESEGRPGPCLPVLREAVGRGDEHRATYLFLLAVLEEMADERGPAETHYRESVDLDPGFAPAWSRLGQFLAAAGRAGEAVGILEGAVSRFEDPLLRVQYAEVLLRAGRLDEAERQTTEALRTDPGADALYLAGLIDLRRGRDRAAAEHLARATALDPDNYRSWYQLARARDRLGEPEAARAALRRFEPLFRREVEDRRGR